MYSELYQTVLPRLMKLYVNGTKWFSRKVCEKACLGLCSSSDVVFRLKKCFLKEKDSMMRISVFSFLKYSLLDFKEFVYNKVKYYDLEVNRHVDLGSNLRIKAIENLTIGEGVKIADGVFLHCGQFQKGLRRGKISIGNNVYIGPFCVLFGEGEIEIGDNCLIAPGTIITSQQHTFADCHTPIRKQPSEHAKIVIEDDVWIGSNAVILPGIKIELGSIVGAGAVVTKNIPPYSVAVGVPAKVIKKRIRE